MSLQLLQQPQQQLPLPQELEELLVDVGEAMAQGEEEQQEVVQPGGPAEEEQLGPMVAGAVVQLVLEALQVGPVAGVVAEEAAGEGAHSSQASSRASTEAAELQAQAPAQAQEVLPASMPPCKKEQGNTRTRRILA